MGEWGRPLPWLDLPRVETRLRSGPAVLRVARVKSITELEAMAGAVSGSPFQALPRLVLSGDRLLSALANGAQPALPGHTGSPPAGHDGLGPAVLTGFSTRHSQGLELAMPDSMPARNRVARRANLTMLEDVWLWSWTFEFYWLSSLFLSLLWRRWWTSRIDTGYDPERKRRWKKLLFIQNSTTTLCGIW